MVAHPRAPYASNRAASNRVQHPLHASGCAQGFNMTPRRGPSNCGQSSLSASPFSLTQPILVLFVQFRKLDRFFAITGNEKIKQFNKSVPRLNNFELKPAKLPRVHVCG